MKLLRMAVALAVVAILAIATMSLTARAQSQQAAFETISIKRVNDDQAYGSVQGNRYTAHGMSVLGLLYGAYRVSQDRVVNLPAWGSDERFEVVAAAEREIQDADLPTMLQGLLRDRFGLRAHREMRDSPVYRLQIAKPGAPFPAGLTRNPDCEAPGVRCGGGSSRGVIIFTGMTMNALATALSSPAERRVLNETELDGRFNVNLSWSPSLNTPDYLSLFTAVQEQLGLKLVPSSAQVEWLVVESVSRPTPN